MALLFWKRLFWTPTQEELDRGIGSDAPVSDQHPLPTTPTWQAEGDTEHAPVDEGHPLPVQLLAPVRGAIHFTRKMVIPGIATANALDAGDVIGSLFAFRDVPTYGLIVGARLWDPDDDILALTLNLFSVGVTSAASDAALATSAMDSLSAIDYIQFSSSRDLGSGKIANEQPTIYYHAPNNIIWCVASTDGTPSIATVGVMPQTQLISQPMAAR